MTDEETNYVDTDSPPPRAWLVELAVMFAMLLVLAAVMAGVFVMAVANGPRFD